jgi:tetratricopeptide (TPR) repeat protein
MKHPAMALSGLVILLGCGGRTAGGERGGSPSGGVRVEAETDGGAAPAVAAGGPEACADMLDVEAQDAAGDFLSFAIVMTRALDNERDKVLAFVTMARTCRLAGMNDASSCLLSRALETEREAKVEDVSATSEIVEAYLEAGELDTALEIAGTMKDSLSITKDRLLKEIALAYVEEGQDDRAIDAVGAISAGYEAAEPLLKITEKHLQAGRVQEAFATFESIEDELIKAELLGQLVEMTGDLDRAVEDAKAMNHFGHRIRALTNLADACVASGKISEAGKVLEVAVAVAQASEDGGKRLTALAGIASAYARAGQAGKAGDLFSLVMQQAGSIAHPAELAGVCEEAARWYLATGEDDKALEALGKIKDKERRQEALVSIGMHLAEEGLVKKAAQTAAKIKDDLDRGLVYEAIAVALAADGKYDEALEAAKKVKDGFFRTQAILAVAGKSALNGDWEAFLTLMKKVLKAAKAVDKGKGAMGGGPIVMGVISSKFMILTSVVEKIETTGRTDLIPAVLGEALELAGTFKAKDAKALVLTYLADRLGRAGQTQKSHDLLSEALDLAGKVEGSEDRNWVLSHIAETCAGAGDIEKGLEVAGGIEPEEERAWTVLAMIEALEKENEGDALPLLLEEAFALAGTIQDGNDRAVSLIRIAMKGLESGKTVDEEMRQTLQELAGAPAAQAGSAPE